MRATITTPAGSFQNTGSTDRVYVNRELVLRHGKSVVMEAEAQRTSNLICGFPESWRPDRMV